MCHDRVRLDAPARQVAALQLSDGQFTADPEESLTDHICLAQSRLTNIAPLRKSPRFGLVAASSTEEFPSYSLRKRHALFR